MAAADIARPNNSEQDRGTPPVFIPCRNLPDGDTPYTVREICACGEKPSGYGSMIGAQRIGNLWRLYPKHSKARIDLLLKGIQIRGQTISPSDKNPFIVRNDEGGAEVPTTKLVIGNLPLSYSNEEIMRKLEQIGCDPHSKLMMEKDRDERGGLTRWLTGRRFIYIAIPSHPLPTKVTIGFSTVSLYHREQKPQTENTVCSRCLVSGHRAATCEKDIVCRTCKKPGHKAGDPTCNLSDEREQDTSDDLSANQNNTPSSPPPPPPPPPLQTPRRKESGRRSSEVKQGKIPFPRSQSVPRDKRAFSPTTTEDDTAKSARLESQNEGVDSPMLNAPNHHPT